MLVGGTGRRRDSKAKKIRRTSPRRFALNETHQMVDIFSLAYRRFQLLRALRQKGGHSIFNFGKVQVDHEVHRDFVWAEFDEVLCDLCERKGTRIADAGSALANVVNGRRITVVAKGFVRFGLKLAVSRRIFFCQSRVWGTSMFSTLDMFFGKIEKEKKKSPNSKTTFNFPPNSRASEKLRGREKSKNRNGPFTDRAAGSALAQSAAHFELARV